MARAVEGFWFPILASAARTATTTAATKQNPGGFRGLRVYIDVTAADATASVTFSIQVQDPIGLDWATLLDSAAQTAAITAPVVLDVYPGEVAIANVVANRSIGRSFRVVATHANGVSVTYSVAGEWLP